MINLDLSKLFTNQSIAYKKWIIKPFSDYLCYISEVAIEYLPSTTNKFDIYMINTKDLFILFYDEFDIQFPLKV